MRYTVVFLADEHKGFTAVVPALPGCVSEGDSVEEVLDMVAEAISLYLDSAEQHGEEIPVEHQGTLVGEVEIDSGRYRLKDVEPSSDFQKS